MRSDEETLAALRRGDEQVFVELVQQHQALMLRVASRYVRNRTLAEEVVQETWLGVLNGLDRFEGRASMKTWIFRILINRAISRAQREGRTVPFSSLADEGADEPAVTPTASAPRPTATRAVGTDSPIRCRSSGCSSARRWRGSTLRSASSPSASSS